MAKLSCSVRNKMEEKKVPHTEWLYLYYPWESNEEFCKWKCWRSWEGWSGLRLLHWSLWNTYQSYVLLWSLEIIRNGSPYWRLIIVCTIITQFSHNINFSWSKSIHITLHLKLTFSLSSLPICRQHIYIAFLLYHIHFSCRNCLKVKTKRKEKKTQ